MEDPLNNKPRRFSKVGITLVSLFLILVGACALLLFKPVKRVDDVLQITTSGGPGLTATYQAEPSEPLVFTTNPQIIAQGQQPVELSWDIPGAEHVRIEGLPGTFSAKGTQKLGKKHALLMRPARPDGNDFFLKATMKDGGQQEMSTTVAFVTKFLSGESDK